MKQLFDLLPAIVFFAAFYLTGKDIIQATAATMVASALQVALGRMIWKRIDRMHLAVFGILMVFGGLTLFLHNETFIKWKPTIVDLVIVAVLGISEFTRGRNLVQVGAEAAVKHFGEGARIEAPPGTWRRANIAAILFFGACAGLNLYVAYHFSTEVWLNVKTFFFPFLNIVFAIALFAWLWRHVVDTPAATGPSETRE